MTAWGWGLLFLAILAALLALWRWRASERAQRTAEEQARQARETTSILTAQKQTHVQYLRALDEISSHPMLLIDEARNVVWFNRAAHDVCVEDVGPGRPLSRTVKMTELVDLVDTVWEDHHTHERQLERRGNVYYAIAKRIPGETPLVALRLRDVTELQRLGRARRDFVANISHDLRTPIAAIQVMVETLQGQADLSEKRRRKLLEGIADQTATLQQLAEEMKDLSMIESGRVPLRLVSIPAPDLIKPMVQRMQTQAEHKEMHIRLAIETTQEVLADEGNIQRVLQNLVHNAIKFSPPGSEIIVGAIPGDDEVQFFVRDRGPGIAPEDIGRVFERFYKGDRTRSHGGTGLGLAIARHIVEGHGGRIWVESEFGSGATFWFTLLTA